MKLKAYVAGKFEEVEAVRKVQQAIKDAGHTVTHDWTYEDPGTRTGDDLKTFLHECAVKDMAGVESADALVLLNHDRAFGAMVEFGLALAKGIPVFVLGMDIRDNIFFHLGDIYGVFQIDSVEELLQEFDWYCEALEALDVLTDPSLPGPISKA